MEKKKKILVPKWRRKTPPLEDPDEGHKGALRKETSREETPSTIKEVQENKVLASPLIELLLRELLIQDKKGLEREGPKKKKKHVPKRGKVVQKGTPKKKHRGSQKGRQRKERDSEESSERIPENKKRR